MKPEEALKIVEIAEITVNGKDTAEERIGEFRELVKKALKKMMPEKPELIDTYDEKGRACVNLVCKSCGEELDIFTRKMKFCPNCGKRFY